MVASSRNNTEISGNTIQKDQLFKISPHSATVLASYNCSAACENCCFDSHPGIKTRLSLDEILKFIDDVCKFNSVRLLCFSGGECFLLGKDLDIAIKYANNLGLRTRCVTNGYWARTIKMAKDRLMDLKRAGLNELNFSTGDFHQKFVPQTNIVNGVLASTELEIITLVVVEVQKERIVTANSFSCDANIMKLLKDERGKKYFRIIESPWMPMSEDETVPQNLNHYISRFNVHNRRGCADVLHNVVATPTGKIGLCCGLTRELIPELNIELLPKQSLQDVYKKAANDFMKIWIFVDGPEKILSWAASKNPKIKWEGKYVHHCHACLAMYQDPEVRETIKNNYKEKVNEVLMRYSLMTRSSGEILLLKK